MRKDDCKSKPPGYEGRYPNRPSSPQDDINRRQVQNFQGHCLQSQAVLSENLEAPVIPGNKGKARSFQNPDRCAEDKKEPGKKSGKP